MSPINSSTNQASEKCYHRNTRSDITPRFANGRIPEQMRHLWTNSTPSVVKLVWQTSEFYRFNFVWWPRLGDVELKILRPHFRRVRGLRMAELSRWSGRQPETRASYPTLSYLRNSTHTKKKRKKEKKSKARFATIKMYYKILFSTIWMVLKH